MMSSTRPVTTLFMLQSLDGKISTGDSEKMDFDKDLPNIKGVGDGLHQYYELEKATDLYSLNTGRVIAKIGVNTKTEEPQKIDVSFVIIDSKPHLTHNGVEYLSKWVKKLIIATTNEDHPAYQLQEALGNVEILHYTSHIDLKNLLERLKTEFNVDRITIQSGGTLNSHWVRGGLIDHVSLVIAPFLVGGEKTQSLIGGESFHFVEELNEIKALKLTKCTVLQDSYIHVEYDVLNTK